MSTAVANAKETAVSTDVMDDIFEFAGEGTSFDSSEMQIPFIRLLQPMSPQLNKKKPEYIDGARSSDIFNNVTSQYWDGEAGIKVIACYQTTKYLEFVPLEMGGGFRGEISPNSHLLQQTSRAGAREILPNGNELVKSDQHFCLVVEEDGSFQPAVIDMKSTMLKVSRRWKTQIAMQKVKNPKTGVLMTPPVFATMWRLYAVEESNDKGSWSTWGVEKVGLLTDRDLMMEAKTFRDSIAAGEVKAAPEADESASGASRQVDSDIPF